METIKINESNSPTSLKTISLMNAPIAICLFTSLMASDKWRYTVKHKTRMRITSV